MEAPRTPHGGSGRLRFACDLHDEEESALARRLHPGLRVGAVTGIWRGITAYSLSYSRKRVVGSRELKELLAPCISAEAEASPRDPYSWRDWLLLV